MPKRSRSDPATSGAVLHHPLHRDVLAVIARASDWGLLNSCGGFVRYPNRQSAVAASQRLVEGMRREGRELQVFELDFLGRLKPLPERRA